jgi:hypothetical protein
MPNKDKLKKMVDDVERMLAAGKGLTYEELWKRKEQLCAVLFAREVFIPAMRGEKPDADWRSLYNSLLFAIERHRGVGFGNRARGELAPDGALVITYKTPPAKPSERVEA